MRVDDEALLVSAPLGGTGRCASPRPLPSAKPAPAAPTVPKNLRLDIVLDMFAIPREFAAPREKEPLSAPSSATILTEGGPRPLV